MLQARGNHSCTEFDGKVYVTGGCTKLVYVTGGYFDGKADDQATVLDTVEVFDPVQSSWTAGACMCVSRRDHRSAVLDGKLHVVGGWGTSQHEEEVLLDSVEVYDAAAGCWNLVDEASAAAVRQLVLVSDASNASHAERNKSFVYEYPSCREKPSKHHALHVASAQRHVAVLGFSD